MNIRDAILKAADHIEREPRTYDFCGMYVPGCGSVGCLWGWIGYFLGMPADTCNMAVANEIGIPSTGHLYRFGSEVLGDWSYQNDPKAAAKVLRLYADKYYPAEKPRQELARWEDCTWQPKRAALT